MKILKFGGSSIATHQRIKQVIEIVSNSTNVRAVIFSKLGGVTDKLIEMSELADYEKEMFFNIDLRGFRTIQFAGQQAVEF